MAKKEKIEKPEIKHYDVFGKELKLGTPVAFSNGNSLAIGEIVKINPKMLRVVAFSKKSSWRSSAGYLKYPSDMVVVSGPSVTMYILKNSC
jgi:hypothetical protein